MLSKRGKTALVGKEQCDKESSRVKGVSLCFNCLQAGQTKVLQAACIIESKWLCCPFTYDAPYSYPASHTEVKGGVGEGVDEEGGLIDAARFAALEGKTPLWGQNDFKTNGPRLGNKFNSIHHVLLQNMEEIL